MTNSQKTLKKKPNRQRQNETVHGKIRYRLRKQLEQEGQQEVKEYKKNASPSSL